MSFPTLTFFPGPEDADATAVDWQWNPAAHGWNRQHGHCLIDAGSDVEAVRTWLKEYRDRPRTLDSYRKEAERFLLWSAMKRGKNLSDINRDDVLEYGLFLRNPDLSWCGPTRPRQHPEWKPFAKWSDGKHGLAASSCAQAHVILSNLFNYLVEAGYLSRNPFALKRGRSATARAIHDERLLEKDTIDYLFLWLESLPAETVREKQHAERTLWIVSLYYYTAARLREIPSARMADIRLIRGNWWFRVMGKGEKEGLVPVPQALLEAVQRYRRFLGLSPLPSPGETTPLVCSVYGKLSPISAASLHKIIKATMKAAADDARTGMRLQIAANLEYATTHWLRHSSASHQLEAGLPLLTVSQNLRHAQIETTRRYLHTEDDDRHQATVNWRGPRSALDDVQ
ncbi:tyrosine-type recombinase/integrase [Aquitalea denitrificans]|uniref:tyrosine-type recombinase/integrase n=1 Tax=Aquitalea denitrificans TaxID=519081 RepID=UPI001357F96D|nr:tyrosine-type recombinase/integrase [Aquitalea denitrificans]